jgi:glucokinase
MSNAAIFLGLDIGGTKCAALIGNRKGNVLDRIEWPSETKRGPKAMIQDLVKHGKYLTRKRKASVVGVSIGGPLDTINGIVYSPPILPGWNAIPLKRILQQQFRLPVRVEHDAGACARAEYLWGKHSGKSRLIYLTCGTGFGAGIVLDGSIYHGANGHSIEIGHARYAHEGPRAFEKTGSIEAYCSGTGIGLLAAWKFPKRWPKPVSAKEIASLAARSDRDAQEILSLNAQATGQVCAFLADTLFPDVILLGSLARYLGKPWLKKVRNAFQDEAHPHARRICQLEPASLGPRLQDLSALSVAIQE